MNVCDTSKATHFNPGCALSIYKPDTAQKLFELLRKEFNEISLHKICCHNNPKVPEGSVIINVCAGCDKRFRSLYEGVSTFSVWEFLDSADNFVFPDYSGLTMSIQDPCPVRPRTGIHNAVRSLLRKMNISIVETKHHGENSICCGDGLYPDAPIDIIHNQMKTRADSMPCEEVCVYCVSCIKSMHIGGKKPRYLVDLIMNDSTEPQVFDTEQWHGILQEYRSKHSE